MRKNLIRLLISFLCLNEWFFLDSVKILMNAIKDEIKGLVTVMLVISFKLKIRDDDNQHSLH